MLLGLAFGKIKGLAYGLYGFKVKGARVWSTWAKDTSLGCWVWGVRAFSLRFFLKILFEPKLYKPFRTLSRMVHVPM